MKKTRILTLMLGVTVGFGLLSFAACKPDQPTAPLTLSAGEGGTLTQTTYEVEVGASVADFLKDVKVTPEEGLTFAGWYNGSAPVSTEKMPESGLSLTAKYNVPCTLELYLADVSGVYGEATTTQETAIYGEAFTYSPSAPHFTLDTEKENKLSSEKLGKGETFTAYMKRESYGVHYYLNAPAGAEEDFGGAIDPSTVVYGTDITVLSDSALTSPEWFRFAGWATEANGKVAYQAGAKVSPESDLFLYAVWDRAYEDRFGGGDFIFFPQTEEGVAILRRAGKEYRGTHDGNNFSFKEGDKEIVKGQVGANTFMYYREGLEGETYRHFSAYFNEFEEDGATIKFDGYGNGTYTVGDTVKHGVVSYDPSWTFYTFEGDGEHFDFVLTDAIGSDGSYVKVFMTVGEEIGSYLAFQFHYEETEIKADVTSVGLMLNGLGIMEFFDIETDETLYQGVYESEGNSVVTLSWVDEDNVSNVVNVKLLEYMGQSIMVPEDGWEGTYTDEEGNTLVLDGYSGTIGSAVWTSEDGTEKIEGMYTFDYSPLGDILRLQDANGKITSYRISIDETFSELGDGSYKEYIYFNSQLGYTLLLLGENDTATLYPDAAASDAKVEGKVTKVQDRFLFTSEDEKTVFEFKLYSGNKTLGEYCISDYFSEGDQIYCHYFTYYPVLAEGAEGVSFLESEDGDELTLVSSTGAAIYTSGDTSFVGWYEMLTIVPEHTYIEFYDIGTSEYLFFEYFEGETASSFAVLGELTDIYYWYNPYSNIADNAAMLILFDGEEKTALYYDYNQDDQLYYYAPGTFTYDDNTGRGKFTSTGGSVSFALDTDDFGNKVFLDRNEQFEEEDITFDGEPPLILDAYGYAKYRDKDGNRLEGYYCFVELEPLHDKVYRIYAIFPVDEVSGYEGYFDIDLANKTYTLCDDAIGSFFEDTTREENLEFDGRGNVVYENIDEETTEGTYTVIGYDDYGRLEVSVKIGSESYRVRCYYMVDSEGRYIGHYTKEVGSAGTYVSDKWQYLTIGTFGDAVYTDQYGVSYSGTVTQFTEHIVSFQGAETDVYCVFGANNTFSVPESGWLIDGDTLVKYLGSDETEIKIPDGVKKIAPLAFSEQIYGSAYLGADITSLDLNEVEEIGDNAFNGCWFLVSVKGAKLKKIGDSAFADCIELTTLNLPALEEIGEMAFWLCESLTEVELKAVRTVYSSAFGRCFELRKVTLPAAEKLYEGVFFDCFALKLVTLGANLKQIGTPDEVVAGVFERVGGFEQSPLKVVLGCAEAPTVGKQLFAGVTTYTVVVNDIATVKAFYLAEGWADYNNCVGCQGDEEYVGTYYNYRDGSVYAFVLDETLHEATPYAINHKGAYEVRDDGIYSITFSQWAEGKYTETKLVTFGENGSLVYDPYEEGPEYSYTYFKAGKEFTLHVGDSDAIVFIPGEFTSLAAGNVYEVPAKWTTGGTQKDAKVKASYQAEGGFTLYLKAGENRYAINSLSTVGGTVTASLGREEFDPVIKRYTMSDESLLVVSQNNKEATDYTVSFVLAAIRDENNVPFSLSNVAVEKNADGTFTAKESRVFAGYSYKLTFTLNGDGTFSYTYTCDREIVVESADKSAKVVAYQSATGEITSVTLFVNGKEVGNGEDDIKNFVLTHEQNSKVYRWLVYEYNYAGSFTFTFMGEGETLTGNLSVGTVVTGYLNGVYAIAFYEGTTRTDFYMGRSNGEYSKVAASDITEGDGYLTVKFQEMTFYVTLDLESRTALVVFADVTYQSDEYSDLEGSVRVERNPDGTAKSMTLTMGDKSYTTFTEYPDDYESYCVITDGTDYYYVTMGSSSCRISALTKKEVTGDNNKLKFTLLIGTDTTLKHVGGATYDGKPVTVNFFPFSDYDINKECAWLEVITAEGTKFYRANVTDGTVAASEGATLTTADGNYRVTVIFENGKPVKALHLEVKSGDTYVELPISWEGPADYSDEYNYEIDDKDYVCYYFNIVNKDGVWEITFHHQS